MGIYNKKSWVRKRGQTDSKWEKKLKDTVLKGVPYHNNIIPYIEEHDYEVDFTVKKPRKTIFIEAKGCFEDSREAAKYRWVRKVLKANEELVFLFMNPNNKLPWAKKRKDGTTMTHAEWAEYHKFRWFTEATIGQVL